VVAALVTRITFKAAVYTLTKKYDIGFSVSGLIPDINTAMCITTVTFASVALVFGVA
jgi:hypothetical protein